MSAEGLRIFSALYAAYRDALGADVAESCVARVVAEIEAEDAGRAEASRPTVELRSASSRRRTRGGARYKKQRAEKRRARRQPLPL